MNALAIVNQVVEAENPKDFLRRLQADAKTKRQFNIGEEVIHGTGVTRDIMDACLEALRVLSQEAYDAEIDDEIIRYLATEETEPDFDPEYYLYEHLFDVLQKYCPPFTYFGSNEADGAIGCWPPDSMAIEELADNGELTHITDEDDARCLAVMHGDFSTVDAPYALIEYDGDMELWCKATRQKIWHR